MKKERKLNNIDFTYDLLDAVYKNKYSGDEAYTIFSFVTDLFHNGQIKSTMDKVLLIDNYEYTALCHTAPLELIAKWRYEGWPDKCSICQKPLNYKKYYWMYYESEDETIRGLAHIKCMPKYPDEE